MSVARLVYVGLDNHSCLKGILPMGNDRFEVVVWVSYYLSSRKGVWAMGDQVQACCLSLGRWSEPSYLAVIYLMRPWSMMPSCTGAFDVVYVV